MCSKCKYGQVYLYQFMWMEVLELLEQKLMGHDPFWFLVALVAADNSMETLKQATKREKVTEAEVVFDEEDQDSEDSEEDEDEDEDLDDKDLEKFYFFDCIGCKAIFRKKS